MIEQEKVEKANDVEFVSLVAGGQGFCIDIKSVREIRRWTSVTPLPNAPTSVLGVMNLRGAVIPIMDLATQIGLQSSDIGARSVVVVAAVGDKTMGLLVDAVSEILTINSDDIRPNPTQAQDGGASLITGLLSIEDTMLRVLDLREVVDEKTGQAA